MAPSSSSLARVAAPAAQPDDAPRSLRLHAVMTPPPNPKDRGPLCTAAEIAERVFNNQVSWKWVLANLPIELRVKVGRKVCFRLHDAQAYLDSLSHRGSHG